MAINLPRERTCSQCKGTGAQPGTPLNDCPQCQGQGFIQNAAGLFNLNRICPVCKGRDGKMGDHYVEINITIPQDLTPEQRQIIKEVYDQRTSA